MKIPRPVWLWSIPANLAIIAAILVAGCGAFGQDLDISQPLLGTINNNDLVVSSILVKTISVPKTFEAYSYLEYRRGNSGSWTTIDNKIYHLSDLPAVGKSKQFIMEAFCQKGTWRVVLHIFGTSSQGQAQDITEYYPGPSSSSNGKALC